MQTKCQKKNLILKEVSLTNLLPVLMRYIHQRKCGHGWKLTVTGREKKYLQASGTDFTEYKKSFQSQKSPYTP